MQQLSLLAPPPSLPVPQVPGLAYVAEYISVEEERSLMAAIDAEPWRTEWQRRRQVYGISYGAGPSPSPSPPPPSPSPSPSPFPNWLAQLARRIVRDGWIEDAVVNSVINEYLPGQGIAAHHDYAAFGPTVVAVSLGSACILELQKPGASAKTKELLDVQPRSLWVMGGEARKEWQHGIAARQADVIDGVKRPRARRISITFRTAAR